MQVTKLSNVNKIWWIKYNIRYCIPPMWKHTWLCRSTGRQDKSTGLKIKCRQCNTNIWMFPIIYKVMQLNHVWGSSCIIEITDKQSCQPVDMDTYLPYNTIKCQFSINSTYWSIDLLTHWPIDLLAYWHGYNKRPILSQFDLLICQPFCSII